MRSRHRFSICSIGVALIVAACAAQPGPRTEKVSLARSALHLCWVAPARGATRPLRVNAGREGSVQVVVARVEDGHASEVWRQEVTGETTLELSGLPQGAQRSRAGFLSWDLLVSMFKAPCGPGECNPPTNPPRPPREALGGTPPAVGGGPPCGPDCVAHPIPDGEGLRGQPATVRSATITGVTLSDAAHPEPSWCSGAGAR